MKDREVSQLEASSSSGLCCNNDNLQETSSDQTSKCKGINLDQLVKARNLGILKLSPGDEVEGELIYYQRRLLCNASTRKRISGLYSNLNSMFLFLFIWVYECTLCGLI